MAGRSKRRSNPLAAIRLTDCFLLTCNGSNPMKATGKPVWSEVVCGLSSLGMLQPLDNRLTDGLSSLVMELLQGWLPLIGSAFLLQGILRFLPASRP